MGKEEQKDLDSKKGTPEMAHDIKEHGSSGTVKADSGDSPISDEDGFLGSGQGTENGVLQGPENSLQRRNPRRKPSKVRSVEDLMGEEICLRAGRESARLKGHLSGKIVLDLGESSKYLFDWSGKDPECGPGESDDGDCVISMTGDDLMGIASGKLNPQICMLSNKIHVSGKTAMAIYFFNLISPLNHI